MTCLPDSLCHAEFISASIKMDPETTCLAGKAGFRITKELSLPKHIKIASPTPHRRTGGDPPKRRKCGYLCFNTSKNAG